MTQTSQPRKSSSDNESVSTSSHHPATNLRDNDEGAGEATDLLSKHSATDENPFDELSSFGAVQLPYCVQMLTART